jgi:hypothetical protein
LGKRGGAPEPQGQVFPGIQAKQDISAGGLAAPRSKVKDALTD